MVVELLNAFLSLEWAPAGSQGLLPHNGVSFPFPLPNFILTYNEFS